VQSILPFLDLPGDQVVTVPPGTYSAGIFSKTRPLTTGPYRGALVLVAEAPGSVVLDLAPPDAYLPSAVRGMYDGNGRMVLESGAQRLILVGFKHINGQCRVSPGASELAWWYPHWEFPTERWFEFGNTYYPGPRTFDQCKGLNMTLAGATFGKTGTAFIGAFSRNLKVQGSTFHGPFTDKGPNGEILDPNDVVHPDCFAAYSGRTQGLKLYDSSLMGRWGLWDGRRNNETDPVYAGRSTGADYQRVWNHCSQHNQGFTFAQFANASFAPNYGVIGTMKDIRCWGSNNGSERIDYYTDGPTSHHSDRVQNGFNRQPSRISVVETNVLYGPSAAPSGGLSNPNNPATLWRAAHPYESWRDYFQFTSSTVKIIPMSVTVRDKAGNAATAIAQVKVK
jgi:hypothetical protein